ncbi:MAG: high frequency lysogenization protein HflD [Pseudomonadales bacterium]|nr:high frequency lysogenization protein HflD [Pseudomonadales bacterium]
MIPDDNNSPDLSQDQQRCLALAGVFQAATLVTELAQKGTCDVIAYQALIDSLFVFEPQCTLDVYAGNTADLQIGLQQLKHLSQQTSSKDFASTAKYALSLLALQKHARKDGDMLNTIRRRLEHAQYGHQHFSDDTQGINNELAANLSGIYQDTLSTLKFRIQIQGNMEKLTNTQISDRIRALLFAGFRSALLWQQLGGTKWQLIFKRGAIENTSKQLLDKPIQPISH